MQKIFCLLRVNVAGKFLAFSNVVLTLFSSYRCRIHRGRYFDEGMSQKDSRGDSKGPASTQKLNYLYLYFERGDSQHKNIPINTPSKPPYRAFEIFHLKLFI